MGSEHTQVTLGPQRVGDTQQRSGDGRRIASPDRDDHQWSAAGGRVRVDKETGGTFGAPTGEVTEVVQDAWKDEKALAGVVGRDGESASVQAPREAVVTRPSEEQQYGNLRRISRMDMMIRAYAVVFGSDQRARVLVDAMDSAGVHRGLAREIADMQLSKIAWGVCMLDLGGMEDWFATLAPD